MLANHLLVRKLQGKKMNSYFRIFLLVYTLSFSPTCFSAIIDFIKGYGGVNKITVCGCSASVNKRLYHIIHSKNSRSPDFGSNHMTFYCPGDVSIKCSSLRAVLKGIHKRSLWFLKNGGNRQDIDYLVERLNLGGFFRKPTDEQQ